MTALKVPMVPAAGVAVPLVHVTHGIYLPSRPHYPIFLEYFPNGIFRSKSSPGRWLKCWHDSELASRADQFRLQILYFRPSYARFLYSRLGYAVLAQPLLSANGSGYRPRYAVFGGHFMP
jgi:hypothetical protein